MNSDTSKSKTPKITEKVQMTEQEAKCVSIEDKLNVSELIDSGSLCHFYEYLNFEDIEAFVDVITDDAKLIEKLFRQQKQVKFLKAISKLKKPIKESVDYSFCMINYSDGVIIRVLAKSPHNTPFTYRKMVHDAGKSKSLCTLLHDHTQWARMPQSGLYTDIWKLLQIGYVNKCTLSKQSRQNIFHGRFIL